MLASPVWLLAGVAIGAILTLLIAVVRCVRCIRLIRCHRITEFDDLLSARLQLLAKTLRIRRVPRIVVSDVLFGPAVLGLLRHTIVLPKCLLSRSFLPERTSAAGRQCRTVVPTVHSFDDADQTQEQLRTIVLHSPTGRQDLLSLDPILAHELIHIRRGDLCFGMLQVIVQSLWWFHPAVWMSNRWLSREAERCCDEQVIAELGCSPAQYARSLLAVIESKHALQPIPVFPGMKPVEITTQRMERIMSLRNGLNKRTPLWCWLAVAVPQPAPSAAECESIQVYTKADFAPLVELIKASVEPESWGSKGVIAEETNTLSLVVRQTREGHKKIGELLSKLRNAQDQNVHITSLLVKLATEEQLKMIEEHNTLHSLADGIKWALLTPKRSEAFTKALLVCSGFSFKQ